MIQKLPAGVACPGNDQVPQSRLHEGNAVGSRLANRGLSFDAKRRIVSWSISAFTIGLLMIVFGSPNRNRVLSPGPLSSAHAALFGTTETGQCAACHAAANDSFASWISVAVGNSPQSKCQSDLCLECHGSSISSQSACSPHNVDPGEWRTAGWQGRGEFPRNDSVISSTARRMRQLACRDCHREHQGDSDLTQVTDQQCQSCHQLDSPSFESGHPEFEGWPSTRPTGILFDHVSHGTRHFPGRRVTFDCSQCHHDDRQQNIKTLAPYSISCAGCHDPSERPVANAELRLVSLPMIDLDVLQRADLTVGDWPRSRQGRFGGEISPLMRLLLSSEKRARLALEELGPGFQFSNIDPNNKVHLERACDVAWSIKLLLNDLNRRGPGALKQRLEQALKQPVTGDQARQLLEGLEQFLIRTAVAGWFPDLEAEVDRYQREQPAAAGGDAGGPLAATPPEGTRQDVPHVIGTDGNHRFPAEIWQSDAVDELENKAEWQPKTNQRSEITRGRSTVHLKTNSRAPDFGTWLASEPEKLKLKGRIRSGPPGAVADTDSRWPLSGWRHDDRNGWIGYQRRGHADRVLTAWTNLVLSEPGANTAAATSSLFDHLTSNRGADSCTSCHAVDQLPDASFVMHWSPRYRDPTIGAFTRFSHAPHLQQELLRDCGHCHQLDDSGPRSQGSAVHAAIERGSDFRPIRKSSCSGCHSQDASQRGCGQCHNYHVGSRFSDPDF